jgi:hypothetical protein
MFGYFFEFLKKIKGSPWSNEADTTKMFKNISEESKESFLRNKEVSKHSQQKETSSEESSKSKIKSVDGYLAENTDFSEDEFGFYTSEEDFRAYTSEEDNDSENNLDTKSQRAFSFSSYFQKPASEVSSNSNILESKSNPQKTTVTKKRKRKRKILQKIDGHMSGFGDCQSKNYYESLTDEDLKCPICLDLIEGDFVCFPKEAKK